MADIETIRIKDLEEVSVNDLDKMWVVVDSATPDSTNKVKLSAMAAYIGGIADGKYIPLAGSAEITGSLLPKLTDLLLGSEEHPWQGLWANSVSALAKLIIPGTSPSDPDASRIYLWANADGNYSETPGGGGVADIYDLTLRKNGTSLGTYNLGEQAADINIPIGWADLTEDSSHKFVSQSEKDTWSAKQNAISDLTTIRGNANKGATAYSWGDHRAVGYLTEHQSLAGYATQSWVQQQGYLTEHQSLAGYATEQYVGNAISALGLGTASKKDAVTTIVSGGAGLPTAGTIYTFVNNAVTAAQPYKGVSSTAVTDGGTEMPTISGYTTRTKGDVVAYNKKEFIWEGNKWRELGDEGSYALKTVQVIAGTGLAGGGAISQDVTLSLSSATIASLGLADTALQASDLDGYVNAISQGTGNYVTGITKSGKTLTITRATLPTTWAWSNITGKPTKLSDFTDDVVSGHYLPLSGGTLTGTLYTQHILPSSALGGYNIGSETAPFGSGYFSGSLLAEESVETYDVIAHGTADLSVRLAIPTSAPTSPASGKTYLWASSLGDYAETPSGGGSATVYDLTIRKNGTAIGTYNLGTQAADVNIPVGWSDLTPDSSHRFLTDSLISTWNAKQDAISDLATIRSNASHGNTAYGWGDHSQAGYLTSYTETDPVFSASAAAGITSSNISSWNGKYTKPSTGIPKTDLASAVQTTLTNADTAYGWGNHASAGYLTSSSLDGYVNEIATGTGNYISGVSKSGKKLTFTYGTLPTTIAWGSVTGKPTTISGYGITDAKIANGTITLGSNSITPLTSFTETDPTVPSWAKASTKPSYGLNEITGTSDLKAIEALTGTGLAKRTADNTWELTDTADKAGELVTSTEEDAMFTYRQVPSEAVGDVCKVTAVKGKSVVWNQLVQNGDFSQGTSGWQAASAQMSVSDGTLSFTATAQYGRIQQSIAILNHTYYLAADISSANPVHIQVRNETQSRAYLDGVIVNGRNSFIFSVTGSVETNSIRLRILNYASSSWSSVTVDNVILVDLTLAGLDDLTAAEFEALYPDYHSYNAGELVNNAASGVEMLDNGGNSLGSLSTPITEIVPTDKPTVRLNQLIGEIATSTSTYSGYTVTRVGSELTIQNVSMSTPTTANWTVYPGLESKMIVGHQYYIKSDWARRYPTVSANVRLHFSGGDGMKMLNTIFTCAVTATNVYFRVAIAIPLTVLPVGSTLHCYIDLIDLTEMYGAGNEPTSTAEVEELIGSGYIPYTTGEDIPNRIFPDGMKSAGSVADEWGGTTATKRIGVVDLGTLTWSIRSNIFIATINDMKMVSNNTRGNILCTKYATESWNNFSDKSIIGSYAYAHGPHIKDSSYTDAATFKAAMSGVLLYYELATPVTYTTDQPLPGTLAEFESGGTMRRLPVDTTSEVIAPMVCDFQYGANMSDVAKACLPLSGGTVTGTLEAAGELIIPDSAPRNPNSTKVYLYCDTTGNYYRS